jgi:hypothetical protein
MPKRTDLQSILILGLRAIVIGQAAEFDYSGTQAVPAQREEGYRVILVNNNPGPSSDLQRSTRYIALVLSGTISRLSTGLSTRLVAEAMKPCLHIKEIL